MGQFVLDDQLVAYRLRQSKRAKRISIRFDGMGVFEIVYPRGAGCLDAAQILAPHQGWMRKTLQKHQRDQQKCPLPRRYIDGARLPYLGDCLTIALEAGDPGSISTRQESQKLVINAPPKLLADEDAIKSAVQAFYRRQAKAFLPERAHELAQRHGFHFNQLRVKNQKTRWGSCSAKRNLNFNLRLMMTPPPAIDYVIMHELCHLRYLNHGRDFWQLLRELCPDVDRWRQWFKRNGRSLVF